MQNGYNSNKKRYLLSTTKMYHQMQQDGDLKEAPVNLNIKHGKKPNKLILLFLVCSLHFLAASLLAVDAQFAHEEDIPKTTHISEVLNRLVDPTKYDKRLRPRYGEGPVHVGITLHVSSISAVSEVDMDFTLDFYLRQYWTDPRLAFGKLDTGFAKIKELTVGVDYLEKLWKPDTFFPNEKKSIFHLATTHNSFLRIDPDGKVSTSQRLTVTATCPMQLKLFPMDTQECKLEIESYGYTTDDIDYYWGMDFEAKKPPQTAVAFSVFSLPQFRRTGYRVNITTAVTSSGAYDRLYVQVVLSRNLGFYLMNIILPAMLIVSISWVSFWLNREASPARTTLGVTTVLTMTTLITTTNNSMPKVSYIKGLDVFLNFCFVMVFASLVEYAVVSYLNKRKVRSQQAKKSKSERQAPSEMPIFTQYPTTPPPILPASPNQAFNFPAPTIGSNIPPDCDCRTIPLLQYAQLASDPSAYHQPISFLKVRRKRKRKIICSELPSPSRIDRCARGFLQFSFFSIALTGACFVPFSVDFIHTNHESTANEIKFFRSCAVLSVCLVRLSTARYDHILKVKYAYSIPELKSNISLRRRHNLVQKLLLTKAGH
ncbi:Unc-49B protein [Aphelenchoides bicaudatus]|nr:Unc-49B protein [Aphelenchoides bicaudatus]